MITRRRLFHELHALLHVVLLVSLRPVSGRTPGKDINNNELSGLHGQLSSSGVESGGSGIKCLEREKQALLRFKDELVDRVVILSSWGNEENKKECCKWRGVRCHNRTNHVIALELLPEYYPAVLKGNISSSLLKLQQLQYLDLGWNDFGYRPIPEFIGSLTNLRYLILGYCGLSGPIPRHIGNLSKLVHLDLSGNDHYSESLDWVSSLHSLEHLDLKDTNLSMATKWLPDIGKLTSLEELHLSGNMLVDMPPSSLPQVNSSNSPLAVLDLSRSIYHYSYDSSVFFHGWALIRWFSNFSTCGLTSIDLSAVSMPGPIPDFVQNMVTLEKLSLSRNSLEGGIPSYFGNKSSLIDLDLGLNNLIGEFSELVMNLSGSTERKLESLWVEGNKIRGPFTNMSRFSSLVELSLRQNLLNGSIPEGYVRLPNLLLLDLSSNQLIGPVPNLSFSSSLKYLNLYNNTFNDTLPKSIGQLSNLHTLWISSNLIKGVITEAFMSNLSHLQRLDLSFNSNLSMKFDPHWVPPFQLRTLSLRGIKLGPEFPLWLKTQMELAYIDISNAGISNTFPDWFIAPTILIHMNVSNNQMDGVIPELSFSTNSSSDSKLTRPHLGGITLDLSSNRISGPVTFLCETLEWKFIDLSDNLLFDRIPDCFANFKHLQYLNLANNHFFGRIPLSFGSLSNLTLLHLRNNSFSGELPENCTELNMVDLGENRFTGEIPSWMLEFEKL